MYILLLGLLPLLAETQRDPRLLQAFENGEFKKTALSEWDVRANYEFMINSGPGQQLFSFVCFFHNFLLQLLNDAYQGYNLAEGAANMLKELTYDIDGEFRVFHSRKEVPLKVKASFFIIDYRRKNQKAEKLLGDYAKYISFVEYDDDKASMGRIASRVNSHINEFTDNFMSYNMGTEEMEAHATIYLSILYFKGSWAIEFEKYQKQTFTKLNKEKVERDYVRAHGVHIPVAEMDNGKVLIFILPFGGAEGQQYDILYISPQYTVETKKELADLYLSVSSKYFSEGKLKSDEFEVLNSIVEIPEFEQTSDGVDLLALLPETYGGGPSNEFNMVKTEMKIKLKIDEKGVEAAAACMTYVCSAGIGPEIEYKYIRVLHPYAAVVRDGTKGYSLFSVSDIGEGGF